MVKRAKSSGESAIPARGFLVKLDEDLRTELEVLALDQRRSLQALSTEAICDLLEKHGRPAGLRDALKKSAEDVQIARKPAKKNTAGKPGKSGKRR